MKQTQIKAAQTKVLLDDTALNRQGTADELTRNRVPTGGHSQENRHYGFRPAFMDVVTGTVYRSCFADGRPAPFHLLEGLPDEVVAERDASGDVTAARSSIVAGFVRRGRFYSREEAARFVSKAQCIFPNRLSQLTKHLTTRATAIARMGRAA